MDIMDGAAMGLSEYYLRESYDQSSSESQLLDGQGRSHRSSRSQTPVTRGKTGSRLSLNSGAVISSQCKYSGLLAMCFTAASWSSYLKPNNSILLLQLELEKV